MIVAPVIASSQILASGLEALTTEAAASGDSGPQVR